jgi:hypothetical protein
MRLRRAKALIWQKQEEPTAPIAFIPKELHDVARKSLIKLFRDSLHLNDQIKHTDTQQKEAIEDDIIEDFQIVSEYIQYLELWLEKSGIVLSDD